MPTDDESVSNQGQSGTTDADTEESPGSDDLKTRARAELLEEENRRLREEYARAQKAEFTRTALGLFAVGILGFLAGVLFPDGREILFAFGFTGLFGGVLTLYLSPKRVVAADVGERVYAALAANDQALATQLGIDERRIYLPGGERAAYLYLPQHEDYSLPDEIDGPLLTAEDRRGLLLEATGAYLFEEFEDAVTGALAPQPEALATQLADAVTEQFELAGAIDLEVDGADERATFRVSESRFGDLDRFDHPLPSFLAVGFVAGLDRPVTVEVAPADEYADWLVTLRWGDDGEGEAFD